MKRTGFVLLAGVLTLPAAADFEGRLAIGVNGEPAKGHPSTYSYAGTLQPLPAGCWSRLPTYWSIGAGDDGIVSEGESVTFTPKNAGWYRAYVGVGYKKCDSDETFTAGAGQLDYVVYDTPKILGLNVYPDPSFVDKPTSLLVVSETPGDPTRTSWTFGDGKSCDDCGEHTYTTPGTYDAKVTASNRAGSATGTVKVVVKPDPPVVQASFDSTPTAGVPVQFQSYLQGGERERTILWDFGDGTTSTEPNPKHTFAAADDYDVVLTVRNKWGTGKWEYSPFEVKPVAGGSIPTSASFTFTPALPVTGQQVSFLDQSKGTITRWRWNFDDGSPKVYTQNPKHTFTQWGRKNVELWVSNKYGRKGIIFFVDVLRHDTPPIAGFTFTPFNVRVGEPVQFTDTSSGGTAWLWDLGEDGAKSTQQHPTYTYRTKGQKSVTLKVSNAYGEAAVTKFFPCDEAASPGLAANFTWSPRTPNPGQPVQFTDTSTGSPEKWSWVVSDGARSDQRHWTHTFAAAGEYAVSLRIDKGSETKITVQTIRVGSAERPVPNFNWSPGSPEPDELVAFRNLSQNATSYLWDFDDGSTSTEVDPQHRFTQAKTYFVKLTATGNGASESITKEVRVSNADSIPAANFNAVPNPAMVGKEVRFTDTSTGKPTQWQWDFGYSNQTSTEQNPRHTFPFEATFLVTLKVTNAKGTTQVTLPVVVKKDLQKPQPDFNWSPLVPAAGEPVTFTDRSTNEPRQWRWTFADGGSTTGATTTHTFAASGTWNVTLAVSNDAGEATLTRSVVITEPVLQADFSVEPVPAVAGSPIRLLDQSRGQPESWKWVIDGQDMGEERNITWWTYEGGEHLVELTVRRGAAQNTKTKEIIVASPPEASFRMSGRLVAGATITFTDTSSGNPTKRSWTINGANAGTDAVITRRFTETGAQFVRLVVENEAGADSVTRYVVITTAAPDRPKIGAITPQLGPCMYSNAPFGSPIEVEVDWRGQAPDSVGVEVNTVNAGTAKAQGPKTILTLDANRLTYGGAETENLLRFTAISGSGATSEPMNLKFFGVRTPAYFELANVKRQIDEARRRTFVRAMHLPVEPYEGTITLPKILGGKELGLKKTQFKLEHLLRTDCNVTTTVELAGALALGPAFGGLKGSATYERNVARPNGGVDAQFSLGIEGFAGAEGKIGLVELIPGMAGPCQVPIVSDICDVAEAKLEIQASVGGVLDFKFAEDGSPQFRNAGTTGGIQATATGSLGVGSAKVEFFGGGKGDVRIAPFSESPIIRKAQFGLEAGARLLWFGTLSEYKYDWVCAYEPAKAWECGGTPTAMLISADDASALKPVAPLSRTEAIEAEGTPPVLLRNVTALADPSAAARDERAVIVYLGENETAGASLQRLDVRAMRRNASAAWSTPANVTSDGNGDFNPAVVLTSSGRAVAAWERIRNPSLSYTDIARLEEMPKLLREVEIAVSTSDASSATWTSHSVLTSNDVYDHQPALAALSDGRTILAWLREPADGGGAQQVIARVLEGDVWSPETIVASDLRGAGEIALAAEGAEAAMVVATNGDLALFFYRANAWTSRIDLTKDPDVDHSPAVAYEGDVARVYWTRGGNLVTRSLPDGVIETVRSVADRAPVMNPIAAVGPDGTHGVIWSSGSDVRAVLRDPATKRWTTDVILTGTTANHASVSAFFARDASLHVIALGTLLDRSRSDLVSVETALRTDLVAHGSTLAAEPRQPNAGERVTIRMDVENAGQMPVRDAVVELRRGETILATKIVSGDWMPGEAKTVDLASTYDPATPHWTIVVDRRGDAAPENNIAAFSFLNRAPAACFQASSGSGGAPLAVTFDAGCSSDTDGGIARYAWSFGEEGGASGSNASHTFATAGMHTIVLTVTDAMGATDSRSMTIDVASPTDRRRAAGAHSLHLSVVGRAPGVGGSFFTSDVAILNTDQERDLTIDAVYLPDGRGDAYHRQIVLRGGELLQTRDALAQLFGAPNGSGSVRFDLSHPHAVAVARTYNDQPSGTAGFSNEALERSDALTEGQLGVILQHWLAGYRTNLGFTEVAGRASVIKATAFDERGIARGSQEFPLAAYDHTQINGHALFQSAGRIELEVRGGAVLAYVSTVDSSTGDPIYQTPARSGGGSSTLLIPVVARLAGVNNSTWRSDVRVFNPNATAQHVTMELRTGGATFTAAVDVAAGETRSFDDVIARAFPQVTGSAGGALMISAPAPLMASSRTFNITAKGTYGLYVPARASDELLSAGESAFLVQLQENATYRCNLGITSSGAPVEVLVRAFDENGMTLATKTYGVAAGRNVQIGRVFADLGVPLPLDAAGLEVTVVEGQAFVYASINDNRTGDGTFVEARR